MRKFVFLIALALSSSIAFAKPKDKPCKPEKPENKPESFECEANGDFESEVEVKVSVKKKMSQLRAKYKVSPLSGKMEGDKLDVVIDGRSIGSITLESDDDGEMLEGTLSLPGHKYPSGLIVAPGSTATIGSLSCSF